MRVDLQLAEKSDWVKLFDPRDSTIFVVTVQAGVEVGAQVRLDLVIGDSGPRVIFRGKVIRSEDRSEVSGSGFVVALAKEEREKINYINGYVRGGLLDLREKRRIPVRLKVTYGGIRGPEESFTRDINEEGVFVVAEKPLPEGSELHLFISFPGENEPVSAIGLVSHTVLVEDEDIPGMGIRFKFGAGEGERFKEIVDRLEQAFRSGSLPDDCLQ